MPRHTSLALAFLLSVGLAACSTPPQPRADVSTTLYAFRFQRPEVAALIDTAVAYAVFPEVGTIGADGRRNDVGEFHIMGVRCGPCELVAAPVDAAVAYMPGGVYREVVLLFDAQVAVRLDAGSLEIEVDGFDVDGDLSGAQEVIEASGMLVLTTQRGGMLSVEPVRGQIVVRR